MNTLITSRHRSCTLKTGAVTFIGVLSFILLVATSLLFAQETIPLVNASFEQPGVEERNWDNVPGWSVDTPATDSGVAPNTIATEGVCVAWLDSDDGVLWQLTDYTIQAGDLITLKADVRNSWQTTTFDLILYYDNNGTRVPCAKTTGDFEGFVDPFLTEFTATFFAAGPIAAVGQKLGVAIQNTSAPNSFIELDNFRLSKATATQNAVELVNASFEQPGVEERNWDNIPGWSVDVPATDSGVAPNTIATDGVCVAWLDSDDGVLWQLTGHTIQAGEVFVLQAAVRNSWQTTIFDLILYYDDNGTRVPCAKTTGDFEGFVDAFLTEFAVTFSTASAPASVGHLLGVAIQNTSVPNSFIEIDNFRLSKAVVTSVASKDGLPTDFALEQNYPNPFNPETVIQYQLEKAGKVQLDIYDLLGHKVRTLVDVTQPVGTHSVRWDALDGAGNRVSTGVYFYRLSVLAQDSGTLFTTSRRMLLIK